MDLRTPLGKARGLGSAKSGTHHFWHQRITAVANVFLITGLVFAIICTTGADFARIRSVLGNPFVALWIGLGIVSVCIHMKLGMQIVIEDYIHSEFLKIVLLMANTFFVTAIGFSGLFALAKISFGG